jgi:hypothetical protein
MGEGSNDKIHELRRIKEALYTLKISDRWKDLSYRNRMIILISPLRPGSYKTTLLLHI